jgi:hypothetical protein
MTAVATTMTRAFGDRAMQDVITAMLNWLTGNCDLLGFNGQNWMLVLAGGLLAYIAVLVIGQGRQTN